MTRNTKRKVRKSLGIFIGLMLGWYMAELAFLQVPQSSYAEGQHSPAVGAADPGHAAAPGHQHEHGGAVDNLVPGDGQTPWFGSVVWYSILLFVGAAVLGPLVLALKGPDAPDPADRKAAKPHAHDSGHGH